MRKLINRLIDKRIGEYQNELVARHSDEVQNMYRQMRGWRHDYHNHIQAMKVHLLNGSLHELESYLDKLDQDLTEVDTVIKTGNVQMDAILNSKLSLIKSKGIEVNAKALVPEKLEISQIDLCIIIGNLLENAMESCLKSSPHNRFIRVFIGILREKLYISVTNSCEGDVKKQGVTYFSTKDTEGHGFGLMRVKRITRKYSGFLNCTNEEGVFAVEVML